MTLRTLLKEMAKKYDQYDDYTQQDAHELLRHLLDSMEMEEKDVVKRLQPAPSPVAKRRRSKKGTTPLPSPPLSPSSSNSSFPVRRSSAHQAIGANALNLSRQSSSSMDGSEITDMPEEDLLVPFVDVLFGGSLASVVVCENCKNVSMVFTATALS